MPAGVYNFSVEQGVENYFTVNYRDGSDAPKDFTGYELQGELRENTRACKKLCDFVFEMVGPPEDGTFKVTIGTDALKHIDIRGQGYDSVMEAYYDIIMVRVDEDPEGEEEIGKTIRILNGKVKISPRITRND